MRFILYLGIAISAGALIALQSVLNSALGGKTGVLGSVFILTLISAAVLVILIIFFPGTAYFGDLPRLSNWYLYLGGVLGVVILAAPIFLIPKIGTAPTLTGLVLGQLLLAVAIDHFGLFGIPKLTINLAKAIGIMFVGIGAYLVIR